jgi:hypothetical protein
MYTCVEATSPGDSVPHMTCRCSVFPSPTSRSSPLSIDDGFVALVGALLRANCKRDDGAKTPLRRFSFTEPNTI